MSKHDSKKSKKKDKTKGKEEAGHSRNKGKKDHKPRKTPGTLADIIAQSDNFIVDFEKYLNNYNHTTIVRMIQIPGLETKRSFPYLRIADVDQVLLVVVGEKITKPKYRSNRAAVVINTFARLGISSDSRLRKTK
jgi:hypothetical protein